MKSILLAIAAALIGAGNGLNAFANGEGVPAEGAAPGGDGGSGEPAKRGRGRPPGGGTTAKTEGAPAGPTDEERLEKNKGLIKPLIDAGHGQDVKETTGKYSTIGIKGIPADKQAAFEKDIEGLMVAHNVSEY